KCVGWNTKPRIRVPYVRHSRRGELGSLSDHRSISTLLMAPLSSQRVARTYNVHCRFYTVWPFSRKLRNSCDKVTQGLHQGDAAPDALFAAALCASRYDTIAATSAPPRLTFGMRTFWYFSLS